MRTRLRGLGVAGRPGANVPRRRAEAAALLLAAGRRRRRPGSARASRLRRSPRQRGGCASEFDRTTIRDLAAEIEWAKVSLLTPQSYAAAARKEGREPPGLDVTAMARLIEAYEDVKQARGVIDFEDVLLLTVGILEERDDIAGQSAPSTVSSSSTSTRTSTPLQQRLLELWLGGRNDVAVVGDASQTIYSFTGATPQHLLGFPARFPGAHIVRLVRNYRSSPQIVSWPTR